MSADVTRYHKADEDRIGFVADYCPVCRTLRAFALYRIETKASGLYSKLAEEPESSGFARVCKACDGSFPAVPDSYTGLSRKLADVQALQIETFRNYQEEYAAQLKLDRIPSAQLTGQDRMDRIQDPMLAIAIATEPRTLDNKMDAVSWGLLAVAAILVVVAWPQLSAAGDNFANYPPLLVGPAIAAVVAAFFRMGMAGKRETLRWATAHLANALAPVRPTDAELDRALNALRDRSLWLGKKLDVERLQSEFEAHRQRLMGLPGG